MLANSGKSDPIVNWILPEPAAFATCALMNNFDCANDASETFLFCNSAYNPASLKNICGRATWIPVGESDAIRVPTLTPATEFVATNETSFRLAEIALTRFILGEVSAVKLTDIKSPTLKDPKVIPAHVNIDTPPDAAPILTSSPIPSSFIFWGFNTKSPEKSTPDINVSSWWTDKTCSKPFFCTIEIVLINDSSPLILIFSPTINVPDTCSNPTALELFPTAWANPVAPLLNPSTKLPIGSWVLDNATLTVNAVNNWISYK